MSKKKHKLKIVQKQQEVPEQVLKDIHERHFYWMPDSTEMFVAALAAVQDYQKWLAKRHVVPEIHVYCKNPNAHFLFQAIHKNVVPELRVEYLDLRAFDQSVRFDEEAAYKLSINTEKHASQMFGIQIGSEPQKSVPDLSCMNVPEASRDILLLPYHANEKLLDYLENNYPEMSITVVSEEQYKSWNDQVLFELVCDFKLIFGERSAATYLAAAIGRGVIEIYPPDRHRNWLSKWNSPVYQMIYVEPKDVRPELVFRAVEVICKRLQAHRPVIVSTPTDQSPSDVESAVSQLLE